MPAKKSTRAKKGHKIHAAKKLGKVKPLTLTANTLNLTDLTTVNTNMNPNVTVSSTSASLTTTTQSSGSGSPQWDIATNKPS
jgi:hypothetical protein